MRQLINRWTFQVTSQRLKIVLTSMLVLVAACTGMRTGETEVSTADSAVDDSTANSVADRSSDIVILNMGATGGFANQQIDHLIASVEEISDGMLRIEPAEGWDVTGTVQDVETAIIEAVASGELDLAWVGARAFTAMGVTDFDVLTAPMFIDSYPLQTAVLDSDIPARMLTGLEELGVNGLAVIGGSLRVPSGVNEPYLGANTYAGSTFHAFRSKIGAAAIKAFGAIHTDVVPEQRDIGLSDGSIDGYENTLSFHAGRPAMARHVTANVALWPGIGVLVVSPDTLARLDDQEQDWLQNAAADTAAAFIDLIDDDREVIQEICDLGGSVYEASESDIASLREAAQTVFDQLMSNSTTATFIEEINEIGESIDPEPLLIPDGCSGEAVTEDPRLPNGTYTTETLTAEDAAAALQARGIEIDEGVEDVLEAELGEGTYTVSIVFDDGRFIQSLAKNEPAPEVGSSGTYEVIDDTTMEMFETCCGTTPIDFSFDGNALDFRLGFDDEEVLAVCTADLLDCFGIVVFESGTFFVDD